MDDDADFESLSGDLPQDKKSKKKSKKSDNYDMIRAALESHLVDYARKKQTQKRDTDLLLSTIEEYLSSFVLLGYNYDGDPVTLVSATTQQQSDSLGTLIQKFMISQNPNPPTAGY